MNGRRLRRTAPIQGASHESVIHGELVSEMHTISMCSELQRRCSYVLMFMCVCIYHCVYDYDASRHCHMKMVDSHMQVILTCAVAATASRTA